MRAALLGGCLAVLCQAAALGAQPLRTVSTALVPDSITVGDVFHAAVRVRVPAETRVIFPDTLDVSGNIEMAGRRVIHTDTAGPGELEITALYPLSAWRPGVMQVPPAAVRIETGNIASTVTANFPSAMVISVLPADTANIEPKAARDVLGPNRVWWPLLLALLLALAIIAALIWWWRRRQPGVEEVSVGPALSPREAALAALERARNSGLIEAGDYKTFYSIVSDALRQYIASLEPDWGADLTTTELTGRMHLHPIDAPAALLISLLRRADLVKFARRRPTREEATQDWESARSWILSFQWPLPAPLEQAVAA
jgi:hypothetical protein